jgi:hypothetical protein
MAAAADHRERLSQDVVGRGERALDVTGLLHDVGAHVVAGLLVDQRGARRQPGLGAGHRGERRVARLDQVARVLRDVARGRDHHRHRLADVAHLVGRQHVAWEIAQARVRHLDGPGALHVGDVGGGDHGEHAVHGARGARVDGHDARVSVRAAQEGGGRHAGHLEVVHEPPASREQARILAAAHGRADVPPARARPAHRRRPTLSIGGPCTPRGWSASSRP